MGRKVEFLRRHPGVVVVVAAVALAALGGRYRSTGEGASATSEVAGSTTEAEERADDGSGGAEAGDQGGASNGSGGAATGGETDRRDVDAPTDGDGLNNGSSGQGGATGEGETGRAGDETTDEPTAADIPPDVAHPRPDVDVDGAPEGSDVAEVARWWAAVYTAYAGAEPGEELAARLEEHTTADLAAELANLPPPASYGLPFTVDGASAGGPFVLEHQDPETERAVRVSVETAGALVVYEVALREAADGWLVADLEAL